MLITHSPEREWVGFSAADIDLKRILVTQDFSPDSEFAVRYGFALAQEYRAELHLLHVLDQEEEDPPEFAWVHVDLESRYANAARKLHERIRKEAPLRSETVTAISHGNAAEEILRYAEEHDIDLICLGVRPPGFDLNKIFGSTTERVLRRANCPVLVARAAAAQATSVKAA